MWVKILKFFIADPESVMEKIRIRENQHLVRGHGVKAGVVGRDDGARGVELEALEGHYLLLEGVPRDKPVHGHHPLLPDTVRPVHGLTGTFKQF